MKKDKQQIEGLKEMTFNDLLKINLFGLETPETISRHIIISINRNEFTPTLDLIFGLNEGNVKPLNNDIFKVKINYSIYTEIIELNRTEIYKYLSNRDFGVYYNSMTDMYNRIHTIKKGWGIGNGCDNGYEFEIMSKKSVLKN